MLHWSIAGSSAPDATLTLVTLVVHTVMLSFALVKAGFANIWSSTPYEKLIICFSCLQVFVYDAIQLGFLLFLPDRWFKEVFCVATIVSEIVFIPALFYIHNLAKHKDRRFDQNIRELPKIKIFRFIAFIVIYLFFTAIMVIRPLIATQIQTSTTRLSLMPNTLLSSATWSQVLYLYSSSQVIFNVTGKARKTMEQLPELRDDMSTDDAVAIILARSVEKCESIWLGSTFIVGILPLLISLVVEVFELYTLNYKVDLVKALFDTSPLHIICSMISELAKPFIICWTLSGRERWKLTGTHVPAQLRSE